MPFITFAFIMAGAGADVGADAPICSIVAVAFLMDLLCLIPLRLTSNSVIEVPFYFIIMLCEAFRKESSESESDETFKKLPTAFTFESICKLMIEFSTFSYLTIN